MENSSPSKRSASSSPKKGTHTSRVSAFAASKRMASSSPQRDESTSPEDLVNTINLDNMLLNERIWKGGSFTEQELQLQSSRTRVKKRKYVTRVQGAKKRVHSYRKQGQSPSAALEADIKRKRKRMLDDTTEPEPQSHQVICTAKHTLLKRKYFHRYNTIINTWKRRKRKILLKQRKEDASLVYFLSEFREFIFSELQKTDLKPLILLKAFYYFFLKVRTVWENSVLIRTFCIGSLKKFLINPIRSSLVYFLKDIAADILSELGVAFEDITFSQFKEKFSDPQMRPNEFYGLVLAWLSNIMADKSAKNVQHQVAEFSDILASKFVEYPRVFHKLMSVLESRVCCVPNESINSVLLTKEDSLEDIAMELDHVSLDENPLYDQSLVTDLNKLIRNENTYTPVFHVKYEPRTSKSVPFDDMLFKVCESKILSHFPDENKKIQHDTTESEPSEKKSIFPENFNITKPKASYIKDDRFWASWDRFTPKIKETPPRVQKIYCGYVPPSTNLNSHFAYEKANSITALTYVPEMKSSNEKSCKNELISIVIPDINTLYNKPKKTSKKKLPPPPFIPLEVPK